MMRPVQHLTASQRLDSVQPLASHGGTTTERAVWQARPVFVKTLRSDDPGEVERFTQEGRVAALLTHPLVLAPIAMTPTQLIYPLVEGESLRDRLDHGPLSVQEATSVAIGVLLALAALHDAGIVHQDVKPENVMLQGGELSAGAVRLVDFGMSTVSGGPATPDDGKRMGTPHFMAPEQFQGLRGEPRSDLYSVGVLLFDALAGHPPFEDPLSWLGSTTQALPELPGPVAIHPLLRSALSRNLAQRPPHARSMIRQLESARTALGLPPVKVVRA